MENLQTILNHYLNFCSYQKRLDAKTIKAYRIDLSQFLSQTSINKISEITPEILEKFIISLHQSYRPKTVKRKIASIKAFFRYMEYKEYLAVNPFNKLQIKFREPIILPRTIPLGTIEKFLSEMYHQYHFAKSHYQKRNALRDIAVIELLFATGMRISELCSLKMENVNLCDRNILIYGKGAKERCIQIGNDDVCRILNDYCDDFHEEITQCGHFFVNQCGGPLSDQAVRRMIKKYSALASIDLHITPHMFRHTFATSLLEADVDIRYIQEMLGHSSINITEIYTHVAMAKQRDILTTRHPRKDFCVEGRQGKR
ncbi:MAG: tyrosine-type recombinase/integrase [Thermoflexaceae bacterium]|nr:tyrosine-type recombinase/integrase [Thermoflexaceae bacterium]